MKDYAVDLLVKMLEIYSPSGKESELSNFLEKEMKSLGFQVRKDKVGNVIGEIGHGKPSVLLCGHMDTVEGQIPVRFDGDKLYGRGAVDAKASLAAMIVAASSFIVGYPGKILVAGVVDEEGGGTGIRHFIKGGVSPDYAIFGEPSGVGKIILGYKGILNLKITCKTPTGHSASPWLFDNAIEKAMELWKQIRRLHLPEEKLRSRFYSLTSCLMKIDGGNASSSMIPSKCDIHIQLRIPPQLTPNRVFEEVKKRIKRYRATNPKVSVTAEIEGADYAFEADRRSILTRAVAWAIRKTTLNYASVKRKTGTGDMNVLGNALKIPVITYGPGDSRLDHTPNEHIDLQEYRASIQVYQKTLRKLPELLIKRNGRIKNPDKVITK